VIYCGKEKDFLNRLRQDLLIAKRGLFLELHAEMDSKNILLLEDADFICYIYVE